MAFSEIKRVNVSDEVYRQILDEIVKRHLKPGDKLPSEGELVRMFNVSRVSVRAALQKLSGAGIVESVNGGGSFVKNVEGAVFSGILPMAALGEYNVLDLIDFRRGIETVSAELAAKNADQEGIEKLWECYRAMEDTCAKEQAEAYSKNDLNFHMQIAYMSRNPFIIYVMEQIREIIYLHVLKLNQELGPENGFEYHRRLVEMIEKHNQAGARECMQRNLLHTQEETTDEWNI